MNNETASRELDAAIQNARVVARNLLPPDTEDGAKVLGHLEDAQHYAKRALAPDHTD